MKRRRIILLLIATPTVILLLLSAYGGWMIGDGYIKTTLDPQYIPTAEYLIQNPIPTPIFLGVNPPPGSIIMSQNSILVTIDDSSGTSGEIADWTHLFLNNQGLSQRDYSVAFDGMLSDDPKYVSESVTFAFSPMLKPGVHLLEIQVGKSITVLFNPGEAYTYTWAYRVE